MKGNAVDVCPALHIAGVIMMESFLKWILIFLKAKTKSGYADNARYARQQRVAPIKFSTEKKMEYGDWLLKNA